MRNSKNAVSVPAISAMPRTKAELDAYISAALANSRSRTGKPAITETEPERVRRVLHMQKGMRGRILQYIVGKGPHAGSTADLHKAEVLNDISFSNLAACLEHISWKMQEISCGYTLAVAGRGENATYRLQRTDPVNKAPRKSRKSAVVSADVPAAPVNSGEAE